MTDSVSPLRDLSFFDALSDDDLTRLHAAGTEREVRPGDVLIRQGDRADSVFVVLEGTGRVELDGAHDVGGAVAPGEWVGELAVLDDAPRAATVIAVTPMRLLTFAMEDFREVLGELPELRDHLTRALTRRLRQVSSGWAALAVDTDILLDAYYDLQGSGDEGDRNTAIQHAAGLLRRLASSAPDTPTLPLDLLTPAERRVADAVARGLSNAAVAGELFLSEHTVASHLKHIYAKLDVSSRVALAGAVLRSG